MSRRALAAAIVALPLVVQGAARADDVLLEVTMVKAKSTGSSDRSLRPWRSTLRRLAGYRAYRVVDTRQRECAWAHPQVFALPGGRRLYVTPKGRRGDQVLVHVRLIEGTEPIVESDVQLGSDDPIFLGMNRDADAGDGALFIMLTAGVQ